ncbi:MAG: hypothetical protein HY898_31825 [Deltaproteobacteria bacterium]|nr:hypothetical protein [Deltaproteobacteria bacterium]
MSDSKPACGPPVDVVKTDGVRVARCPCGTLHVTFQRTGVTMQLSAEYFNEVVQALSLSKTILEPQDEPNVRVIHAPVSRGFVTIETPGFKKPSN